MKRSQEKSQKKEKKNLFLILLLCTIFTSGGQVLMKYAMNSESTIMYAFLNVWMIVGLLMYATASIFLIIALRKSELSIVYPFLSLSFVWVTLLSIFIFHEHLSIPNLIGIGLIIIGISAIGQGASR